MATFVPVPAARIFIRGMNQGRPWSMSLWACNSILPVAPTYGDLSAISTTVAGALTGNAFLGFMGNSCTITEVEVRDASSERSVGAVTAIPLTGTGGASAPSSTSAKVLIQPAPGTPFRRPSQTFLPGVPVSALTESADSNELNSTYIAAAEAFLTSIAGAIAAAVANWVLAAASQRLNGVPRVVGLVVPYVSVVTRALVATQVRRLRRVGRKESAEALAARAARMRQLAADRAAIVAARLPSPPVATSAA